jgi:hypothetical protein
MRTRCHDPYMLFFPACNLVSRIIRPRDGVRKGGVPKWIWLCRSRRSWRTNPLKELVRGRARDHFQIKMRGTGACRHGGFIPCRDAPPRLFDAAVCAHMCDRVYARVRNCVCVCARARACVLECACVRTRACARVCLCWSRSRWIAQTLDVYTND